MTTTATAAAVIAGLNKSATRTATDNEHIRQTSSVDRD
jgi:hypothetical protein